MRRAVLTALFAALVSGCGSQSASPPTPTPPPTPSATPSPPPRAAIAPTATVVISRDYAAFLETVCHAFATQNANTLINELPYYQYNSGLRYGWLGDGEGQTGDPGLMRTWVSGRQIHCRSFSPGVAGHGTLLTSGWALPNGHWSLIDLDKFGSVWKFNDFTFGTRGSLIAAMHINHPVLSYHG